MELCLFDRMGALTQSVEYLPFKQRVARSNRARPTTYFEAMLSSMAFFVFSRHGPGRICAGALLVTPLLFFRMRFFSRKKCFFVGASSFLSRGNRGGFRSFLRVSGYENVRIFFKNRGFFLCVRKKWCYGHFYDGLFYGRFVVIHR